ncbi:MAG: hypothetical protein K8L99_19820 [Anaerolineae bacterium]|nr:hypothetical protein [Anaerolineae bacterium]
MIDPNVVYLALVFGLWLGVTATYIPGTGIAELMAVVALIGSALLLMSLPTNWVAVLLIVVGVLSFIVVPFLKRDYAPLALVGLVLQGIGGWFLFYEGPGVSPVLIALTLVAPLVYHQYVLLPMLDKMRAEPVISEDTHLIGAHGRVIKALNPTGTVNVRGEAWTATSDEQLEPGTEVVVIDRDGLQVQVEKIKQKRSDHNGHSEGDWQ